MKAIILCGGYATRLQPITLNFPKHLLEINKKPILEYIYEDTKNIQEIDEFIIITNNKFFNLFEKWAKSKENQYNKIKIINDLTNTNEERLGGIGDLNFVINKLNINDDLLIICGDNFFEFSLKDFVEFSKKHNKPSIALYNIKEKNKAKRFGVVHIKDNLLDEFHEKPKNPKSSLISTGIYYFPKSYISYIKEYMKTNKNKEGVGYLILDLYPKDKVYTFIFKKPWYDVGTVQQYKELQEKYKDK